MATRRPPTAHNAAGSPTRPANGGVPDSARRTAGTPTRPSNGTFRSAEGGVRPVGSRPRSGSSRRSVPVEVKENTASRAFQSLILVLGVILLFAFFFGLEWGTMAVGMLIFASAFPPVRRHVDRWLVGTAYGPDADQSSIIRMAVGVVIAVIALIAVF